MKHVTKKNIFYPKRRRNAKKGDSGRVLIIGGSKEYAGALSLSGMAALRAGADWVTIAAPQRVSWNVESCCPDLVTVKLSGDYLSLKHRHKIMFLFPKHNVFLMGGGAGLQKKTKNLFLSLARLDIPKVIDADGIKALSPKDVSNAIVTPHRREAEIFFKTTLPKVIGLKDIQYLQKKLHQNTVVLLKGAIDYIFDTKKIWYNTTGNPGMAKAGTGDILAGLAAGYLAQSKDLMKSAITAAYINGQIGDMLLTKRKGEYSFVASDLVSDYKKYMK